MIENFWYRATAIGVAILVWLAVGWFTIATIAFVIKHLRNLIS